VLCEDGERVLCRGWRDHGGVERKAVLAVLSGSEHPTPGFIDRLAHEYALRDELDGRSAVRPLALVREHGRTVLLLEDPGGEPLDRLIGQPMETGRFLRVATGLSAALRQLHERGLIHKDIKPANVLVDFATGQVWLTGFGIASRAPRERQSPEPPEFIAGTLPYMAPEQTGRMNRSIDSRSDLYSLGVTLYEMLTGALPFMASDPMEWVHCHIARQPVPPVERLTDLPVPVSAIVSKLLAKTAEERYQTAAGLESDLRRCVDQWERQRRIEDFPLGENDTPAADPREIVWTRTRDRHIARRFRSNRGRWRTGIGACFGICRSRKIVGCQRAPQGTGSATRPFCNGQIRPVQARHPLRHIGASVSEPRLPVVG
jgi:serine/threonine protein kinase